jgi:hypothetical protein
MAIGKIPYTAAFNRLGKIRSAGITDLRYGLVVDEDWQGRDRFERSGDLRKPLPLPGGLACYAIAATSATEAGGLRDKIVGDGLVPVASALGQHENPALALTFPEDRQAVVCETGHLELLGSREVYEKIKGWLAPDR